MRAYRVWRRAADLEVTREVGSPLVPGTGHRVAAVRACGRDYYSWPLDLDDFTTGASDYDMISNEVYCPCGDMLPNWDSTAGDLLRMIYTHCESNGHPKPRYEP